MKIKKICEICGAVYEVPHWRSDSKYCSALCRNIGLTAKPNVVCTYCGKPFHMKENQKLRYSRSRGFFCSRECLSRFMRTSMLGEGNHQFGLRGSKNSSFKGNEISKKNNNLIDIRVYAPDHPFCGEDSRVLKHRLIVEEHADLFDDRYFTVIDGKKYLLPSIEVHHKDFNHNNNDISNLEPLTKGEHVSKHNARREIVRGKDGRIIGVVDKQRVVVKFKRLYGDSEDVVVPTKQHKGDAAFDLYLPFDKNVYKGRNVLPLGFSMEIPDGFAAFVRSRSGFSAKGMEDSEGRRMNADVITGLVDSNYRGEVGIIVVSDDDFLLKKGTRIAQMQFIEVPRFSIEVVDELSPSDRGVGGYGSSGV